MRFAVIGDTREWSEPAPATPSRRPVNPAEVDTEARRRKALLRLDEWRMREFVTGLPMPEMVRQQALQIDLAAQALCCMSPIPSDFADDIYWPRIW